MDMDVRLIGSRVKAARQGKHLTQEQLAEKLGSVGHIECGRSNPSLQTLIRVARICGVSMDYLTGLVDAPHLNVASAVAEREALSPAQTQLLRDMAQSMVPFVRQIKK